MTTLEKLEELIYVGFKETDKKWQETQQWLKILNEESEKKISGDARTAQTDR